jgi:hypothetical protein
MPQILIRPGMVEALHKMCGSLEVARDLVARSGVVYVNAADTPDGRILELMTQAAAMLSRTVEALQEDLGARMGPAA